MGRRPAKDIVRQYRPVLRWRYEELRNRVTATELGVQRALVVALGGKTPPDMPSFEEALESGKAKYRRPAWMARFEEANKGRVIQTG